MICLIDGWRRSRIVDADDVDDGASGADDASGGDHHRPLPATHADDGRSIGDGDGPMMVPVVSGRSTGGRRLAANRLHLNQTQIDP